MNDLAAIAGLDVDRLRAQWLGARPFGYVVLDDVLTGPALDRLRMAVAAEPHWPTADEIVAAMVSAPVFAQPGLLALQAEFASDPVRDTIASITGVPLGPLLLRSYVYLPGHALLAHRDWRAGIARVLAVVVYLHEQDRHGGELLLYEPTSDADRPWRVARSIAPRPGRVALFEVSERSLHAVAELTGGARIALSGWFYAPGTRLDEPTLASDTTAPVPFEAFDGPVDSATAAGLAALVQSATYQRVDAPDRGHYLRARLDTARPEIARVAVAAAKLCGRPVRPLAAECVITAPGDYALSLQNQRLRPPNATHDIVVDLSDAPAGPGAELIWHELRGNVAIAPVNPGRLTVVAHRGLGMYLRRTPSIAASVTSRRVVLWAASAMDDRT